MSTVRPANASAWRPHVAVEALAHVAFEVAVLLPKGVEALAAGTRVSIRSSSGAGPPRVVPAG